MALITERVAVAELGDMLVMEVHYSGSRATASIVAAVIDRTDRQDRVAMCRVWARICAQSQRRSSTACRTNKNSMCVGR